MGYMGVISKLLLFLMLAPISFGHGEGGYESIEQGKNIIEFMYSEKPLNQEEPVLFMLSLKNKDSNEYLDFDFLELIVYRGSKAIIKSSLAQDFDMQVSFTYRFLKT